MTYVPPNLSNTIYIPNGISEPASLDNTIYVPDKINSPILLIKRGTRTEIEAAKAESRLLASELYLISDEGRLALGTSTTNYEDFVKASEIKNNKNGFVNRTDSSYTFIDGTRTFKIVPVSTSFTFWANGVEYVKTVEQTVVIDDVEGQWFVYFNNSGVLSATQSFTSAMITEYAFISIIYWDAANNTAILIGDERHGCIMDSQTHLYLHNTHGSAIDSPVGLAITNIVADGSGNAANTAQIGVSGGGIWDEDIEHIIATAVAPASLPVFYLTGTGLWRRKAASAYPVLYGITGTRANYNLFSGGVWTVEEAASTDFVLSHLFATNDPTQPIIVVAGQDDYGTAAQARAGVLVELQNLNTIGLPTQEFVAIGSLIFETNNGYANVPKSRIRTTDAGDTYVDWRTTRIGSGGNAATVGWGNITGLLPSQVDLKAELDAKLPAASYTAVDVLAKLITVDGSTSGLDADLLDGQQGSYFAPLASPTFTGTVSGITKAMVGLTNVDDTTDAGKPVSTATQTALNLKANLASPVFTGNVTGLGAATGTSFNSITGLASVNPLVAGTAAVGTSTLTARQDHVHPAQTTVTGNAGTATTLQTPRTINGVSFNGSANITINAVDSTARVQQGGGTNQGTNAVKIGWGTGAYAARLALTIDTTDFGWSWPISISQNAATVTTNANLTGEVTSVGNAATVTNAAVIGKVLTGYVSGAGTVAATDTLLQAINKLNGNVVLKLDSATYTAADVLAKLVTVDGSTSGIDADLLDGQHGSFYAPIASPTFTGTVSGITKTMVGLSNVDNTTDAAKPVSTATQTALNLKADIASPIFTGNVTGLGVATGTSFNSITGLASVAPLAPSTAAVGTSPLAARQDHVHPVQTTISGNAGTATTLVTGRTIAMTGDVTYTSPSFNGSANVTAVATIANDVVTYAKFQNVSATDKLLGRVTAGAGDVEEIACTAAGRALLDDVSNTDQRTTLGLGTSATVNTGTSGAVIPLLSTDNDWTGIQSFTESRWVNSYTQHFSQSYTPSAYLTTGEFQEILTVTPSGSFQNYEIHAIIYIQTSADVQILNVHLGLRSDVLPVLSWSSDYDERLIGNVAFVKPVLWTKQTTTSAFKLALQHLTNSVHNITAQIMVINRIGYSNTVMNTVVLSDVSVVPAGYTSNDITKILRCDTDNFSYKGNTVWTAGNDGSASGLDADLLDGNHASAFSLSGHNHSGVYEPVLSNPVVDGYVLSSTAAGVRSWVQKGSTSTDYGAVGTYVIALSYSGAVTLGNTISGSSLYKTTDATVLNTDVDGSSLLLAEIDTGVTSLGLSGTWRLLTTSNENLYYVLGLFVRVS